MKEAGIVCFHNTKYNYMKNIYLVYIGIFLLLVTPATAQTFSRADSVEIKDIAIRNINKFEALLNLISQEEDYFRKYGIADLFRKYYEAGSPDQIFMDSTIIIEDDINPGSTAATFEIPMPIKDYLNQFFKIYEKSASASVFFSNFQVSEIYKEVYVQVAYESLFTNRNKQYPDRPFQKHKKVADLKIIIGNGEPEVLITHLGFQRTPTISNEDALEFDSVLVSATAKKPEITQEAVKEPEKKPEAVIEPNFSTQTDSLEKEVSAQADSNAVEKTAVTEVRFTNLQKSYTIGNKFILTWDPSLGNPATLSLYKDDKFIIDLKNNITIDQFTNTLPKTGESGKIKPGNDYNFRLYDSSRKVTFESGRFKIKSKFPLTLQIPVYAVAGVGAFFLIKSLLGPGPTSTEFPEPVKPE